MDLSIGNIWQQAVQDPKDWFTGDYQHRRETRQQLEMWQKNYDMQKEFAKHGIQWKVQDAKRAGINPLAALGATTVSGSPIPVGGTSGASGSGAVLGLVSTIANIVSQTGLNKAKAKLYNAQAENIQSLPPGQTGTPRTGTGTVESIPVTQEMMNKKTGYVRAGIHPELTWEPVGKNLYKLNAGPNATGLEEDPGAVARRQKFMLVDLKMQSRKYEHPAKRKGPGYRRFKKTIEGLMPDNAEAPQGRKFAWDWQSETVRAIPKSWKTDGVFMLNYREHGPYDWMNPKKW
jgi:hypothetical protein